MKDYALVIDYKYCTGCHTCEVACRQALDLGSGQFGIKLLQDGPRELPNGKWEYNFLPMPTSLCDLCAERVAALNMLLQSGQTRVKRIVAFREKPPYGGGSGMPCGACRELMAQLMPENYKDIEIMLDYEQDKVVTLGELTPEWWIG